MRQIIWSITLIAINACTSGDAPSQQWELAVQGVYSAALSQDGEHSLIGSVHHGGSYWQVSPMERLYDWNHEADKKTGILASAISDDASHAATAEHRKIVLWSIQTGEAFWLWEAPADIQAMDLNQDGSMALLGMDNYEAALFDIKNGGVKRRLKHNGIVQAVDMTPDLRWAITGDDDSMVKVWNLNSGELKHSWELNNQIKAVAISANGQLGFASSHRGETYVWDLMTGDSMVKLPKVSGHYRTARFHPDGNSILTGTSSGQVHLWSLPDGKNQRVWRMPPRNAWVTQNTQVLGVAFSSNGYRAIGANGIVYDYR